MGGRYLGRKFAQALVTILAIVVLNFILFRMMPGSPERVLLRNQYLTQEKIAQVRAEWGLDKPVFPDQLVGYLQSTARGDLGYSFFFRGTPVTEVIGQRFWPTIMLIGAAEFISIIVGLIVGRLRRLATRRHGGPRRERRQPGVLLDAVLRHRHAAHPDLRVGPWLVPDLGHADGRCARTPRRSTACSTSRATSSCR